MAYSNDRLTVRDATAILFRRYAAMVEKEILRSRRTQGYASSFSSSEDSLIGYDNLAWMCRTALENIDSFPVDKLNRWLGFVQGVLCMKGLITVEGERDYSRPLFHEAYQTEGLEVPASRSMAGDAEQLQRSARRMGFDPHLDEARGSQAEENTDSHLAAIRLSLDTLAVKPSAFMSFLGELGSLLSLLMAAAVGAALAVGAVTFWPKIAMTPILVTEQDLHIGTDSFGNPTLCDNKGNSYSLPSPGNPVLTMTYDLQDGRHPYPVPDLRSAPQMETPSDSQTETQPDTSSETPADPQPVLTLYPQPRENVIPVLAPISCR